MLALFLALGGTTYAASTALIGKNSVASPQVVNGSLQTKDLSAKARKALKGNRGLRGLTGAKVRDGRRRRTGRFGRRRGRRPGRSRQRFRLARRVRASCDLLDAGGCVPTSSPTTAIAYATRARAIRRSLHQRRYDASGAVPGNGGDPQAQRRAHLHLRGVEFHCDRCARIRHEHACVTNRTASAGTRPLQRLGRSSRSVPAAATGIGARSWRHRARAVRAHRLPLDRAVY